MKNQTKLLIVFVSLCLLLSKVYSITESKIIQNDYRLRKRAQEWRSEFLKQSKTNQTVKTMSDLQKCLKYSCNKINKINCRLNCTGRRWKRGYNLNREI